MSLLTVAVNAKFEAPVRRLNANKLARDQEAMWVVVVFRRVAELVRAWVPSASDTP